MKVALVHSFYSGDAPSGENIVVQTQYEALRKRGLEVRIIGIHTDDLSTDGAYKLRTAIKVATGYGRSPLEELRKFGPDIVHVHNLFPNWATSWLDQWPGKVIATVHNYRPACAAGTLFRGGTFCDACPNDGSHNAVRYGCYKGSKLASVPLAIQNRRGAIGNPLLRRANRIIVLSLRAQGLYESFGIDLDKLSFVPNFVEDNGFMPSAPLGSHWAYIGRLSEEKGIVDLLQHWPENQELRIFGDGALRNEVSKFCGRNVFLEGPIDRSRVPTVLSHSRGLIFPSLTPEGAVPLTYVEALAAARPTLSRSGNGAADDIQAHGTGQVFGKWDEVGMRLSSMDLGIESFSSRARKHYENSFTTDIWGDATTSLYEDVLREGRRG
jgi:glycosyltransferase involved in cell wall biosynthesis